MRSEPVVKDRDGWDREIFARSDSRGRTVLCLSDGHPQGVPFAFVKTMNGRRRAFLFRRFRENAAYQNAAEVWLEWSRSGGYRGKS